VRVHIDADLACEGHEKWKRVKIDKCIAPIVKALQKGGINMRGSCCGHGKDIGEIELSDGRKLLIYPTSNQFTAPAPPWITVDKGEIK
jgi:hypothetical protein